MKLSPETKHTLMIGGALILAVVLGIIVYKKFEANSQASQAATSAANDQADQDTLAYLESLALGGGDYSSYEGSGGSSITIPSAPASTSLAQELSSIEQAFGYGTTSTPTAPSSGSSSSGSSSSGSSSGTKSTPVATHRITAAAQPLEEPVAEYVV